ALLLVAGPATDEYDRDVETVCSDATLDLEAVHVRHADVEHEARSPRGQRRAQEIFPRGEHLGLIAEGPDQAAGRLPDRCIVVNDGDELRVVGRLAPFLATRAGSRHGANVLARGPSFQLSLETGADPVPWDRVCSQSCGASPSCPASRT